MVQIVVVGVGAALGGISRFLVTGTLGSVVSHWPLGTFTVNVTGSFAAGLLAVLLTEQWAVDPYWRLLVLIGFLGSFTTFSTYELETLRLLEAGSLMAALANWLGSAVAGLVGVWGGTVLGRML